MPDGVSFLTDENISLLNTSDIVRGNTSSNIIGYTWGVYGYIWFKYKVCKFIQYSRTICKLIFF